MSKSIEQQAAAIIKEHAVPAACDVSAVLRDATAALSRAGLLVSERDVLCRGVVDGLAPYVAEHYPHGSKGIVSAGWRAVIEKVEALAAYDREHAPKPRYYVEAFKGGHPDTHRVIDRTRGCIGNVVGFGNEHQCNAIAAALNALAEKEARNV